MLTFMAWSSGMPTVIWRYLSHNQTHPRLGGPERFDGGVRRADDLDERGRAAGRDADRRLQVLLLAVTHGEVVGAVAAQLQDVEQRELIVDLKIGAG